MVDAGWSLLVAESRTGRVTGRLPLAGLQWQTPLHWGDTYNLRATIGLDGPPGDDDRSVTKRVQAITNSGWRFMLVPCYRGTAITYGYVGPPAPSDGTVDVGCSDLYALMMHRVVVATGQRGNLAATAADTTYSATTLANMVRLLLLQGTSETGQGLPLTIATPATSGVSSRTWAATDLRRYSEAIRDLNQADAGPDVTVTPVLSDDQTQVSLRVDIGEPYLGQKGSPWTWNCPGNCVDIDVDIDPSGMGDSVFVPGNGSDKSKPIGYATGGTLAAQGFPSLDVVDTQHGSEQSKTILDSYARNGLTYAQGPTATWKLKVRADSTPVLGTWRPGDTVTIQVSGHYWIPTGTYTRRIVSISGDATNLATVETAPVPAEM